jgi:uncharacterized protein YndB with AHSA1/START domain
MSEPLVVSRRIAAPPSVVYAYLTDSGLWARWQGQDATVQAWPGGDFAMEMPGGMVATGEFVELVPDRRVVFTWGWVGHPTLPPGASTVEIEIAPDGAGSTVTLTHRDLPDDEVAIHETGWAHYLPRLEMVATGQDVPPDPGPGG